MQATSAMVGMGSELYYLPAWYVLAERVVPKETINICDSTILTGR